MTHLPAPIQEVHDPALCAMIGANIRAHRRAIRRTLRELSSDASMSESMLSKVENGKAYLSLPGLMHLARALGVEAGALLVGSRENGAAGDATARGLAILDLLSDRPFASKLVELLGMLTVDAEPAPPQLEAAE